jgi:hypothetical protein
LVPHAPDWFPSIGRPFGLSSTPRGEASYDLERGGGPSPAGRTVREGEPLSLRYEPAGYLFLRVIDVRSNQLVSLIPASDDHPLGLHAETGGGRVALPPLSPGRHVLLVLLAATPLRMDALSKEAADGHEGDADSIAARMARFHRDSWVRVIEVEPKLARTGSATGMLGAERSRR